MVQQFSEGNLILSQVTINIECHLTVGKIWHKDKCRRKHACLAS